MQERGRSKPTKTEFIENNINKGQAQKAIKQNQGEK